MQIRRCLAGLALLSLPALAQVATEATMASNGNEIHGSMRFPAPRYRGTPVLGAPYSAQRVTEQVMVGSDGTRFTTSTRQETVWRDSQGRTRTERSLGPGAQNFESPVLVEISDPVADADYILDTQHKVAHRMQRLALPKQLGGAGGGGAIGLSTNTVAAGPGPIPPPPASGTFRVGGTFSAVIASSPVPASAAAASGAAPPRPEIRTEDLGSQMIEGVMARGTRRVETWPVGSQGNDRPFQSVSETWSSPDLKEMVQFKSSDPRRGENTTKLVHIDTSEPSISLFQPPADYTVVDESGPFEIQWTGTRKP